MSFLVRNARDNAVIARQVAIADTLWSRFKGLLGRDGLAEGEGLHIVPCNSIHMFFMKFPIDVAFLDHEGKLVKAIHSIQPWRATRMYADAHSALELPAGTLLKCGAQEGDRLVFEPA
ncbi:MAG: DUF192 domain-containing protein [Myxococcales bacterium]